MSETDTEADMVEIELDDVNNIRVPADALEDALDGLPDKPEDEVAMITDSVIVAGDGDDDEWVRVFHPSNDDVFNGDNFAHWFGLQSRLYDKIDDARTDDGAEYVRENITAGGSVTVEQRGGYVYLSSYLAEGDELRRAVEDDRMEVVAVEPTEYQSDDGVQMRLIDTEAE